MLYATHDGGLIAGGAFHSFDAFVPAATLSRQATRTRTEWLRRALADDTLTTTP